MQDIGFLAFVVYLKVIMSVWIQSIPVHTEMRGEKVKQAVVRTGNKVGIFQLRIRQLFFTCQIIGDDGGLFQRLKPVSGKAVINVLDIQAQSPRGPYINGFAAGLQGGIQAVLLLICFRKGELDMRRIGSGPADIYRAVVPMGIQHDSRRIIFGKCQRIFRKAFQVIRIIRGIHFIKGGLQIIGKISIVKPSEQLLFPIFQDRYGNDGDRRNKAVFPLAAIWEDQSSLYLISTRYGAVKAFR